MSHGVNIFGEKIIIIKKEPQVQLPKKQKVYHIPAPKVRKVDKLIGISYHALERIKEYNIEGDIVLNIYNHICKISHQIYRHRLSCRHCVIINDYRYIFKAEDGHITIITVVPISYQGCWDVVNDAERRVILDFVVKRDHKI